MPEMTTKLILRPLMRTHGQDRIEPLELTDPGEKIIGRASDADWTILDHGVSRQHAKVELAGGEWYITDLGSRHGTTINGAILRAGERLPVRPGDEIRFGTWAARCDAIGDATANRTTLTDDRGAAGPVQSVSRHDLGGVAQIRLDALIEASRELEQAENRCRVAEVLSHCASTGANCPRALVVRAVGVDEFEVLATTDSNKNPQLSRSLLEAASKGEVVQMTGDATGVNYAQSMLDLRIQSAICAPIVIQGRVDSFLYLDSRGEERRLASDAISFCSALAQLGASAFGRLITAEVAARREQLERDLDMARRAQQMLMPNRTGIFPRLRYTFHSLAGRFVAGDLFDILELPDGRTAFFLGDVSGKGAGAGVVMAAMQTHLRALLSHANSLKGALDELNRHVFDRTDLATFLTLVAGVFDPKTGGVEMADAGHGFYCRCPAGGAPARIDLPGGLPIGVTDDTSYETQTIELAVGDRLLLFSDGFAEQPGPDGRPFGFEAVLDVLANTTNPEDDVSELVAALKKFAGDSFADDITAVSLQAAEIPHP